MSLGVQWIISLSDSKSVNCEFESPSIASVGFLVLKTLPSANYWLVLGMDSSQTPQSNLDKLRASW